LASAVIDLTGSSSRIIREPLPQDDPRQRRPDISTANQALGWTPRTKLKDGLVKTIAYFDRLLSDQGLRASLMVDAAST
jgi:UDP-glucuronate decarboxylase